VITLELGGTAYTVPDTALPHLGHGLNLGRFQDKAPVGPNPAPPGAANSTSTDPGTDSTSSPPTRTLRIIATNLAGQPDNGDVAFVTNVDNSRLFSDPNHQFAVFHNGVARFRVPAGHYWAVGMFGQSGLMSVSRVTVLPQFSVLRNATVHMAESAATSKVTMTTPLPAKAKSTNFWLLRSPHTGSAVLIGWANGSNPIWVSPASTAPSVGTVRAFASQQLASPPGNAVPYWYAVSYSDPRGTIPGQHYGVSAASLATVDERYYQAGPHPKAWVSVHGSLPTSFSGYVEPWPFRFTDPGRLTEYIGGNMPAVNWANDYQVGNGHTFLGAEGELLANLRHGERLTDSWNEYPLHPAVAVNPDPTDLLNLIEPSASRAGNTLRLAVTPFGDNQPGHIGFGFTRTPGTKVTGSYQIFQNGKEIASGNPLPQGFRVGGLYTSVRLSAQPSVVRFAFNASQSGPDFPLSTASHTVWTWRSAHEAGVSLPPGWYCYLHGHIPTNDCDVQPMMTLDYAVAGMSLTGQVPAGPQAVSVTVGHLQLAPAAALTKATMSVSFDGGKTWQAASVTGSHGHYRATFNAPAGAYVMTRTTAWDAAGGSVAETITRAYQIAP
jgi:hypothetical protein